MRPLLAIKDWSYDRFSDSRILPLIVLYSIQILVLIIFYAALPALRRSIPAILSITILLSAVGVLRGLIRPVSVLPKPSSNETATAGAAPGVSADSTKHATDRLVRFIGLDVYGESLLSRRAATYLSSAAVLLLVNSLFQFLTFAYLAYQPLVDIIARPAALILSALFAAVLAISLTVSERALLTTELSWRVWFMYVLHLLLAGAIAAIMTTAMMLRIADAPLTQQVLADRIEARLVTEIARNGKAVTLVSGQELERLRTIANAIEVSGKRPTFVEKVQALYELRNTSTPATSARNSADVRAFLINAGLLHPPLNVAPSILRSMQWSLFVLFWLLPSTSMVARLLAPREVDFYFSLTKQVRYVGYTWHEAVAEDTRLAAIAATINAA
jgi:hypothetical protein